MSSPHVLLRKANRVLGDATLRRWLVGRALGRWPSGADVRRRMPDYLVGCTLATRATVTSEFGDLNVGPPQAPIALALPGAPLRLAPGEAAAAFARDFDDLESLLALHRFAWIAPAGGGLDPAWVVSMWQAWLARYAEPDDSWAWHPYTAAERLIAILAFARTHGLPGPRAATLSALVRHGPAIFERLEYFGEGGTGNHLANNGRGLFLAGIALNLDDWTTAGGRILLREAERIFAPSGVLREGSSHYHLLVARWYAEVALAAGAAGRSEASALQAIAARALAVVPHLLLPGGLPLIGDVSPDVPPAALVDWAARAPLDSEAGTASAETLAADGWLRIDVGPWHALVHLAPGGWNQMPGHGHRDCGSFELHHGGTPVIRDIGRRSYKLEGEPDVAASAHNTLTLDEADPLPANKPYYDDAFRRAISGPSPTLRRTGDAVVLDHMGFARLPGVGRWCRTWRFDARRVTIVDRLDGSGRHSVMRHLHTTLPVTPGSDGRLRVGCFNIAGDTSATIDPSWYWTQYGAGHPATRIRFASEAALPWSARLVIEEV